MNTTRFDQIFITARAAKQSLDAKGFIKRNAMAKVTVAEHKELLAQYPSMVKFTRLFDYADSEYQEDVNRMAPSKLPKITEVWVGARSLGCLDIEGQEDDARYQSGIMSSQLDQEDAAELTDLATLLYHDPKTGVPLIEDPTTGQVRPILSGDCITIVRGSNDDLDAVFLEEGDDPRQQNDQGAEGTDHKWSGRFRANTDLEQSLLSNSAFSKPKGTSSAYDLINENVDIKCSHSQERRHSVPNVAVPDLKWNPNEFEIRQLAAALVEKVLERRPEWAESTLSLTHEAEAELRNMAANLQFDHEGTVIKGHFITKDEFFGQMESNLKQFEAATDRRKGRARPAPMDFKKIGRAHAKVLRSSVHKPHLTKPNIYYQYSEAEHRALYEGRAESIAR